MADPVAQALDNATRQMSDELAKAAAKLSPDARRVFYMATRDAAARWLSENGNG